MPTPAPQAGDVTLVDSLGSMQLATQAAISQAFKTPEVIKLFALKQPSQLRQRLDQLQARFTATSEGGGKQPLLPAACARRMTPPFRPPPQRDKTLGKISKAQAQQQGLEVLIALKRLGDKLSDDELGFLQKHMTQSMAQFVAVKDDEMST